MGINGKLVRATIIWATWTTRLFLLAVIVWLRRNTSVWVKASDTDYHGWRTGIWTPKNHARKNIDMREQVSQNPCPINCYIPYELMSKEYIRFQQHILKLFERWNFVVQICTCYPSRWQLGISRKIVKISENSNKF